MTKKEKLRVYNDCVHEVGLLKDGNSVDFCHYDKPWDRACLTIKADTLNSRLNTVTKEYCLYFVDNDYTTRYGFLEVVAIACRHCLNLPR